MPPVTLLAAHLESVPEAILVKVELKINAGSSRTTWICTVFMLSRCWVKAQQIGNAGRFFIDGTYGIAVLQSKCRKNGLERCR